MAGPEQVTQSPHPYYLSVSSVAKEGQREKLQKESLEWLKERVKKFGWARVALSYSLTDSAWQFMEVYRIRKPETLRDAQVKLEQEKDYQELLRHCVSRQLELSTAMPYDPGAGGPATPKANHKRDVFLQAILTLKEGQLSHFTELMGSVRALFQSKKWEWGLIFASRSLSSPHCITHLWKTGTPRSLYPLMLELGNSREYEELDGCCTHQWQRLMRGLEGTKDSEVSA